jgi:excisionase family DNA binding protein
METMSVDEVSAWLKINPRTIRRWAKRGEMPTPVMFGSAAGARWDREELVAWWEAKKAEARARLAASQGGKL